MGICDQTTFMLPLESTAICGGEDSSGLSCKIFFAGDELIARVNVACAVCGFAESVACTVKVENPTDVGTPEITPVLLFRFKPAGSEPDTICQLIGEVLGPAISVMLYAVPTVPMGIGVPAVPIENPLTVISTSAAEV